MMMVKLVLLWLGVITSSYLSIDMWQDVLPRFKKRPILLILGNIVAITNLFISLLCFQAGISLYVAG